MQHIMTGMQARKDSRLIVRSVATVAQVHKFVKAGNIEQAEQNWCADRCALSGHASVLPGELQDVFRKLFSADAAQWWNTRWSKPTTQHPDFQHKMQGPAVLHHCSHASVVDSQTCTMESILKMTQETASGTAEAFTTAKDYLDMVMCKKLCEDGPISNAVNALDQLVQREFHIPSNLYYCVLKRCTQNKELALGGRIHALTVRSGYKGDPFLATHLIRLYASHGKLLEAMKVFRQVPTPDAYNWATIILAYARHGEAPEAAEAVRLYRQMCESTTVKPDDRLYAAVLKACAAARDINAGKAVHARITADSGQADYFVQAGLVIMYAKCGCLEDARRLFDKLSHRNVVTCTAMVAGYTQQGMGQEALSIYRIMHQQGLTPDSVAYSCLLQACATVGVPALFEGRQLHAEIKHRGLEENAVLGGSLVDMYVKCGSLRDARILFDKLLVRTVVTWTAMISGYAQQGMGAEALSLYSIMRQEGLTLPNSVTYVCMLQACASVGVGALQEGKQMHAQIEERGMEKDAVIGRSLVNMYAKCGSIQDARRVFDKLADKNVVAWNAMIAGYAQQRMGQEALSLYRRMQQEGLSPDSVTFVCLLQACARLGVVALHDGEQLHAHLQKQGLHVDVVLGGSLVNMYAKCGNLDDAYRVFNKLAHTSVLAWNAMIAGYTQQGMSCKALSLHNRMQQEGLRPDSVTYVCLLQACANVGVSALHKGKELHKRIEEQGLEEDAVVGGSLTNMYVKCGSLGDARILFDRLAHRNIVSWNTMITGYAHQGMGKEALNLYFTMQQEGLAPDSVTYVSVLQACATVGVGALYEGKQLHAWIEKRGLENDEVLAGCLVNMYAKCGSLRDGHRLFDKLVHKNVVAWNALITGYAQQGMGKEALSLHSQMLEEGLTPDSVTYVCLLQACATIGVGALSEGKQLHVQLKERGLQVNEVLGRSLVSMYARCGSLKDARNVFDNLVDRNVVAWNTMMAAYAQQGIGQEALSLYSRMQQEGHIPNLVTYVCLLQACATIGVGALQQGKQVHVQIEEQGLEVNAILGGCLVNMYAKCGSLEDGRRLFDKLSHRSVAAWNAMIAGYVLEEMAQEALSLYKCMQLNGPTPDSVTYVCLLQACAALAALPLGEQLHAEIEKRGMHADGNVAAALVNMYAKCGSMCDSQRVFDSLSDRRIEAWGALVSGYARQGDFRIVFDLIERMRSEGIRPNEIFLLIVLTACSHVGLVDRGREYFQAMTTDFGISANMEHYVCMVDLLGRAGHLREALQMAKNMPFPPNNVLWHTLLGACQKWKNVEVGQQAFECAVGMDDKDATAYVLMSNIYASCEMWEAAKEMKARRMKLGAWKKPGHSWWTDLAGVVHTFRVGDTKHPETESIYGRLKQLIPKLRKEGYVPHLGSSLLDVPDEMKLTELCGHSEKLAIAYALNKTAEGTTIRIAKNLRVCEDCHAAIGYMSKVEKRTIVCRDANRFHVYKEGKCSCGDYW